jgi:hypothetical protein
LESNDFGRYRCEASNQIGKKWQYIYLVEIKNLITSKLPHKQYNYHNHASHHHKHKISTYSILTTTSLSNIIENTENYDIDYEIDYFKSFNANSTDLLKNQKHNESNMFIIRKKSHKRRKHNKTLEFHLKNQLVDDENDDLNVYLSGLSSSTTQKINSNYFSFIYVFVFLILIYLF